MTDFEFYKLADEQVNLLLIALRNASNLNMQTNQSNNHDSLIELNYIDLVESHLVNKEIKFQSVKEYLYWINKQVQIVNRKIKDDEINYHLGQSSLVLFVFLNNELEKIYFGDELACKVGMANIQLMISDISEMHNK